MAIPISSVFPKFPQTVLPLILRATDGRRVLGDVSRVVRTDRWNSFDRFGESAETLTELYGAAGAATEVYSIPTGGAVGTGRWIIAEAADVAAATLEVTSPVRRRVADYRENPWNIVQWSAATPRGGMTCDLVVLDSAEALAAIPAGSLAGKMILTRLPIYDRIGPFARTGAAGVIADDPVANLPEATRWAKFGWGSVSMPDAARRMVGFSVAAAVGDELRALVAEHGAITVRARADIRHYVGSHEMVSGVVGGQDPEQEIWALSHSAEPGAIDNASGVAASVEIARVLEELIRREKLPRPKRSIRLLSGYECYSFFHYLEHVRRRQTPLAGLCIDGVGAKPHVCGGRLHWHDTVASSAQFVNRLGSTILRETLALADPGYRLVRAPFVSTCDTLIGDPKYGFPCPWINAHWKANRRPYDAYHSSADTVDLLSPAGLAACTAGAAGYLYYLANAGNEELLQMAHGETRDAIRRLKRLGTNASSTADAPAKATFIRDQHATSLRRLSRWIWGGDASAIRRELDRQRDEVGRAGNVEAPRRRLSASAKRICRRTAPLTPQMQNTPGPIARAIRETQLRDWALYWADGRRTVAEIADAAGCESGEAVSVERVSAFLEAHRDLGYVELIEPEEVVSKAQLVADLKALGLRAGMDVICHSSLSRIGHVDGGADAVIDAIGKVIGKRGTLMAPTFNFRRAPVYNSATTPGETGAIGEAIRQRAEAVRSDHPTHPLAAVGARAGHFCADHVANGIWSADSPIGRLIFEGGYILSLGVGQIYSTAYHIAEVAMPCTGIAQFGDAHRVVDPDGEVRFVPSMAYRATSCPIPADRLGAILDRKHQRRHGAVGRAASTLVKARDLYEARRNQLRRTCPTCTVQPMAPAYPGGAEASR